MTRIAALAVVLAAAPAFAQNLELTPLASFTTAVGLDQTAIGVQDLTIGRGFTWGGQATYFVSPHWGLEGLWMYESTGLSMTTRAASADVFRMTTHQLHGNVVYQFGSDEVAWRPFVFGGAGATFFSAAGLDSESKPSWNVGGGLKWLLQRHVGLKVQARYKPVILNDSSSEVCDPFGFCQGSLKRFELAGGAAFRF